MDTPPESTTFTPTLSGARIKLAPHPLNPDQPGCILPVLAEALLLSGLLLLSGWGLPGAQGAALVLGIISVTVTWPVSGTLLVHLLGRLVGRADRCLKLTTATLVQEKPARPEIPLDTIASVGAVRARWQLRPWAVEVVCLDGTRELIAEKMRADEARWLEGTLRAAVSRRRAALEAEGHALDEAAEVPAALRAVQARTK